jgi:hypothetical protein
MALPNTNVVARTNGNGGDVRVLLSTYGGRGDVEPLVALAVRLRALGAQVRVRAPPDWAQRLAEVGVPLVPIGPPVRPLLHGATPPSVAEKLGLRYVFAAYCPIFLPSPHRRPHPLPGRPLPPDVTDDRVLNDLDIQNYNALFGDALNIHRASIGLPPVDNVRDHVITDCPWLAAEPILAPWQQPRPTSTSSKPARGSCPTNAHCRLSWRRSWTPAHHRCTSASAACAPRRISLGRPSRRSARRAAARSSPAARPSWP